MRTNEVWKPIPGYEGLYEVSNLGRVRTPGRTVVVTKTYPARMIKSGEGRRGSRHVTLFRDGIRQLQLIHRLVLWAFVGEPSEDTIGCHNDGNPANNHLDNLRWDTQAGNMADKRKHGTLIYGERQHAAKLTDQKIVEIRQRAADGENCASLAREFGISHTNCMRIIKRETWRHVL